MCVFLSLWGEVLVRVVRGRREVVRLSVLVVAVILVLVAVFKTACLQTAMIIGHEARYLKLDTKIQYVVSGTRGSHGDVDGVRDIKRHATHQISSHVSPHHLAASKST